MKFEIDGSEPKEVPVKLTLHKLVCGTIALEANGTQVLWVNTEGTITFNSCSGYELAAMGFQIVGNKVRVTNA